MLQIPASFIISLAFIAAQAGAQITLVDDLRSVYTGGLFGFGETYEPVFPATDFDPFDVVHTNSYLSDSLSCETQQSSTISGTVLAASGWATVGIDGTNPLSAGSVGEAVSTFLVGLTVDSSALFRLDATLSYQSPSPDITGPNSNVRARILRREGLRFFEWFAHTTNDAGPDAGTVSTAVRLEPGEVWYVQFSAFMTAALVSETPYAESGTYEGTLTYLGESCNKADLALPTGVLDLADIMTWVDLFMLSETVRNPSADINDDGVLDLADIAGFVAEFLTGCR